MAKNKSKAANAETPNRADDATIVVSSADAVPGAAAAAPTAAPIAAEGPGTGAPAFFGRLLDLERTAFEAARKRLAGTRAEKVAERVAEKVEQNVEKVRGELGELSGRVEKELDTFLDRTLDKVGLVRKSRLEIVDATPAAAEAPKTQPTTQAA